MNSWPAQHVGKRDYQEDSFAISGNFFAVADGMGGHGSGDVASGELLAGMLEATGTPLDRFNAGHARMRASNEAALNPRMGTTLTAIWITPGLCTWLHAGDSRLYLLRGSTHCQITEDQGLPYPQDNVLLRCVRVDDDPPLIWGPESMGEFRVENGDVLILCSDGVNFYLDPDVTRAKHKGWPLGQIGSVVRGVALEAAAGELVRRAIEMGGHDNATAVVVEITGPPPSAETPSGRS